MREGDERGIREGDEGGDEESGRDMRREGDMRGGVREEKNGTGKGMRNEGICRRDEDEVEFQERLVHCNEP